MALKDWNKIPGGWENSKTNIEIFIVRDINKKYYYILVNEQGNKRYYDNALSTKNKALHIIQRYMRTH